MIYRRRFIRLSTGVLGALVAHSCTQMAQNTQVSHNQKMVVGYLPITPVLPLFVMQEQGLAAAAGLELELVKFEGAQQVVEALLAGRLDGCPTGTASANLAAAEIVSPGLFKVIAADASNEQDVLDVFMVAKDSPVQKIADLKTGMQIGCGPGVQQVAIARTIKTHNT